ncbi:unnamed protein product [Leptosia nina]|uniref:Glucose-methanol-choline oxidoreductase N-terminal domain-containing protein n=1 Tax=Leptosia nina TaxID=320188 RepID=A0AAV1JGL5_9NEOP
MAWTPPDITPACAQAHANLAQCTIGFSYLALLAHLFGNTEDQSSKLNGESCMDPNEYSKISDSSISSEYLVDPYAKRRERNTYDFIIVGAGSAGCVLANRLSEVKKWRILLLEAGDEEPSVASIPAAAPALATSSADWGFVTEPENRTCLSQVNQRCVWFRGKTMGGSSSINYMVYMRGSRYDYDGWAADGNVGWSYKEVLPYFEKAIGNQRFKFFENDKYYRPEGYLNVEKFAYVDEATKIISTAFNEKGIPRLELGLETRVGADINLSTSKAGKRQSTNAAFIKPIRKKRQNLRIITKAQATKILIDPLQKEAYGIEYYKDGKFYEAYARREVIISAGSINSPKLLKVSGIGPQDELESLNIPVIADLRVGHNLQDHVTTDGLIISFPNEISTLANEDELLEDVQDYYNQPKIKYGPLSTTSIINAIAFINTNGSLNGPPNIQFHFDGRRVDDYYADPASYMASNILPLSQYNGVGARALLLTPRSRGVVLLNKTDPVFGPPLIYPGFFQYQEDIDTLIAGILFAVSLEDTHIFKHFGLSFVKIPLEGCTEYEWGTSEYFVCLLTHHTATIYHPVGTCKMGPAWDKEAVVDPRFNVYGVERLRVIDSSTMPNITRGNTNAPTIMMAEKGSGIIKEDNRS